MKTPKGPRMLADLTEKQVRALGKLWAQALLAKYMHERALKRETARLKKKKKWPST